MAVYVDMLINWNSPTAPRCFSNKESCHMYADTEKELHSMALKIGLKLSWFQKNSTLNHYDLVASKRILAIQNGAISQDKREAVAKWREIREVSSPLASPLPHSDSCDE